MRPTPHGSLTFPTKTGIRTGGAVSGVEPERESGACYQRNGAAVALGRLRPRSAELSQSDARIDDRQQYIGEQRADDRQRAEQKEETAGQVHVLRGERS